MSSYDDKMRRWMKIVELNSPDAILFRSLKLRPQNTPSTGEQP